MFFFQRIKSDKFGGYILSRNSLIICHSLPVPVVSIERETNERNVVTRHGRKTAMMSGCGSANNREEEEWQRKRETESRGEEWKDANIEGGCAGGRLFTVVDDGV